MGLFNLLSPVFGTLDGLAAHGIPAGLRIALWAAILSIGTMLLYKVLSPQARIGQAKRDARDARRELNRFDGEFADAGPLIKNQFVTAFRHIGLVVPGTIIAILPLLCFLVWADNHFGHRLPAADAAPPALATVPAEVNGARATWHTGDAGQPPVVVFEQSGQPATRFVMREPVDIVTRHSAWNWLVGNPLGYLPADASADAVTIALPPREFLHVGPDWLHGWLAIFIPVMFIVSLVMFKWARIE